LSWPPCNSNIGNPNGKSSKKAPLLPKKFGDTKPVVKHCVKNYKPVKFGTAKDFPVITFISNAKNLNSGATGIGPITAIGVGYATLPSVFSPLDTQKNCIPKSST
jgi:hypothetical protein